MDANIFLNLYISPQVASLTWQLIFIFLQTFHANPENEIHKGPVETVAVQLITHPTEHPAIKSWLCGLRYGQVLSAM